MRRPLLLCAAVLSVVAFAAEAAVVGDLIGNTTRNGPRIKFTVPNSTNQDANDLHFSVRVKEAGNVITGVQAGAGGTMPFTNYDAGPMPANSVGLDFDGGDVAAGGQAMIDLQVWSRAENVIFIENLFWTLDGQPVGPAAVANGWEILPPLPGGNGGGGAGNVGGGGAGGQGGGGGTGFWTHDIFLWNLGDKPAFFEDLKVLASMIFYEDLANDVPWGDVDPFDTGGAVLAQPGEAVHFVFETVGAYRGGHVYLNYRFVDDESIVFGDHPVPVSLPPAALAFGSAMLLLAALRRRRPDARA